MDAKQGAQVAHNIISLHDEDEFTTDQTGIPGAANQALLETMAANPRFSAPANDEPGLDSPVELAPTRADCRQAKLLCMWVEILAKGETA